MLNNESKKLIGFMMTIIFHIPDPRWKNFTAFQYVFNMFYMFSLANCICYIQDPAKNIIQKLLLLQASAWKHSKLQFSSIPEEVIESTLNLLVTFRLVGMWCSITSVSLGNFSILSMFFL